MPPSQAATLIQKTWRGYLTRKLLDQYIQDEEHKIESAMNYLKSKSESFFIEERQDEMDFSEFSSIQEDKLQGSDPKEAEWTNGKLYGAHTTEHGSNSRDKSKESPIIKNFFKSHRTEPDLEDNKHPQLFSHSTSKKQELTFQPSIFSFCITSEHPSPASPNPERRLTLPETISNLK